LTHLVALWTLVSALSPLGLVCLPNGGSVMSCCGKLERGAPPALRACCGPARSDSATIITSPTTVPAPIQCGVFHPMAVVGCRLATTVPIPRAPRVDIRLLHSVFLI
jgi:hypothetical protein